MHLRRIACFLLGGWMIGSVLMLCVTGWNYDAAADVASSPGPELAKLLAKLPGEQGRMLLFHMANEANRSYGTVWETTQLLIGFSTAFVLFLERRTRFYSVAIGVMLLLVLFECFIIIPQSDWVGRSVDFVPWNVYSAARDQYWNLRGLFISMEVLKLLVGAGVTGALLMTRSYLRFSPTELAETELKAERSPRPGKSRTRTRTSGEHASRP